MDQMVLTVQKWLNSTYKSRTGYVPVTEDGITGGSTVSALIKALQFEIGVSSPDGVWGPATAAACPTLPSTSATKNEVYILQGALYCKGYNPNGFDGGYGNGVITAIKKFQADAGLTTQDGITTPTIFKALLNTDAYVLILGGDTNTRTIQQYINRDYYKIIGLIPCDGVYSRSTNRALIKALQIEEGNLSPDGIWGPNTMNGCPTIPGVNSTKKFILLLQYALYCNGYNPNGFDGLFGSGLQNAIKNFQTFTCLTADGYAGPQTWASLLVSTGDPSRKGQACDCSTTITPPIAQTLKDHGYAAVGRYLTGYYAMSVPELETIYGYGIKVYPIFETAGTKASYFTGVQATNDATCAINAANDLGFISGTIIYFAVDYDAIDYDVTTYILPYFQMINQIFSTDVNGYKVGIYGPRNVCKRVASAGYSCSSFACDMSSGFSGNLGYSLPNDWAYDQISTITIGSDLGQVEIDNNIMSNKYNSLYQANLNDWATDAIRRGWGPISEETYFQKMTDLFSQALSQNILEEAKNKNPYDDKVDWTPVASDYVALGNCLVNNETYAYLAGTKEYDTYKQGFMRIYEYDANGTRYLVDELKLKPAAAKLTKAQIGFKNAALEFEFFSKIDKLFFLAGVTVGTFHDLIDMWEKNEIEPTPDDIFAALVACILTNGLIAYFSSIICGVVAQVMAPEAPIVGAMLGAVFGGFTGYILSHVGGSKAEYFVKTLIAWMFKELFGEVVAY